MYILDFVRGRKAKGGLILGIKGVVSVSGVSYTIKTIQGHVKIEGNPAN